MLVDNAVHQPFSFNNPNFDDFFNMDLLGGSSQNAASTSSSPRSPLSAFSTLPLTPPQSMLPPSSLAVNSSDPDSLFNLFLEDEYSKMDPLAPSAINPSVSPYDFFGAFGGLPAASITSGSSPESSSSGTSPQAMLGIDPQLVGTPATSKTLSDFDEDEEHLGDIDEEDEDEKENDDFPAVKAGGRGKGRKGTVQSGGIVKKTGSNEDKAGKKELPQKILEPEDWRPSPEEYKKMSSKEKRQLRNKISARNFRVRRKEYISTLEGDIAERDSLIDAIRTELGSSKSENIALRQEITALKRALLDGRGLSETPVLPPPAPLPAVSAAITHQEKQAQQSSPLITANTQKDLPTSPRLGARAFWGGMGAGLGGGGVTPVHTTFVPPLTVSSVLAGKAGAPKKPSVLQENINPAMNPSGNLGQNGIEKKGGLGVGAPAGGFDSFTEMNPFTLKTLDAYRMQLWGKMAAQQHAQQHYQQHPTTPPHSPPLTGLASGLRPHYFTSSKGQSTILSGKNAYPTPPNSPPLSSRSLPYSSSASAATKEQQQHAIYAAIASQTLLGRLGSAFWDAFSGSTGPSNNGGRVTPSWDAEKVRKVLEGKAVVKVVDVDGSALAPKVPVATPRPISRSTSPICPRARCTETLTDILEESMRSLTLNKK